MLRKLSLLTSYDYVTTTHATCSAVNVTVNADNNNAGVTRTCMHAFPLYTIMQIDSSFFTVRQSNALATNFRDPTEWANKWGQRCMTIILSHLNRFKKNFTGRFLGKFVVKWLLKFPSHLSYVATLP